MERIEQILLSIKKASLNSGEKMSQENEVINVVQGSNSYHLKKDDLYQILKLYTVKDPKNLIELKYLDLDKVINSTSHKRFNLPSNKNRFEVKNIGSKGLSNQAPLEQKEEYLSEFISEFKSRATLKANQAKSVISGFKNEFPYKKAITIATCLLLLFFTPHLKSIFKNETKISSEEKIEIENKKQKRQIVKTLKKSFKAPSPPRKKQNQLNRIKQQIKKVPTVAKPKNIKKKEKTQKQKELNNREVASSKREEYLNEEVENDEYGIEAEEKEIGVENVEVEYQPEPDIEDNPYEEENKDDSPQDNYDNDSYESDQDNYPENDEYIDE